MPVILFSPRSVCQNSARLLIGALLLTLSGPGLAQTGADQAPRAGRVPAPVAVQQLPDLEPSGARPSPRQPTAQPSNPQPWSQTRRAPPGQPDRAGSAQRWPTEQPPGVDWNPRIEGQAVDPVYAGDQAGDRSALGGDLWAGTTVTQLEKLIATLPIPPRSTAVHNLWQRTLAARGTPPRPGQGGQPFAAVQSEVLFRSGLLSDAYRVFDRAPDTANTSLLFQTLYARAALSIGEANAGCPIAKRLVRKLGSLPKSLTGTATLMIGYCAVQDNNRAAAGLAADFAVDNGLSRSAGVTALRAFSVGTEPSLKPGATLSVMDVRIIEKVGGRIKTSHLKNATPATLSALATSRSVSGDVRIAAGEAALKYNAISLRDMTDIYRGSQTGIDVAAANPASTGNNFGDETHRAALFNAAETEQSPLRKARNIRGFLDSARRAGLYWHGLRLMAGPANQLALLPEIGWFAETGIETSIASGDYASARRWATFASAQRRDGGANLDHWQGLIDIADPGPTQNRLQDGLARIETAARRGLFGPVLLHRLATVLDAVDTQVPIPLWEMASRTPQPTTGHLPETGVLSALQNAAKKREFGHMVLRIVQSLGPDGPEGAHMIALGDSIRALKRAGLKTEARALGIEALFGSWPRSVQ